MGRDSFTKLHIIVVTIILVVAGGFFLTKRMSKVAETTTTSARSSQQIGTVNLAWDASVEPNPSPGGPTPNPVTGYELGYGPSSGTYPQTVDVGNVTAYTLSGLQTNAPTYIVARAYNAQGVRSTASNEVVTGPTVAPPTPSPSPSATPPKLIILNPAAIIFNYVVSGPSPAPQSIQVTTTSAVSWNSFDTSPWFDANPTSGASGASTTLKPNMSGITGLPPGNYSQDLKFTASGCPDKIIAVKLVVSATAPTPTPTPGPPPTTGPTRPHPVDTVPPGPTSHPELTAHP